MTVPNILADLSIGRHALSLFDENFAYLDTNKAALDGLSMNLAAGGSYKINGTVVLGLSGTSAILPSTVLNGNLSIPTNATNTVSLAGGDIGGSGKPRLLFKPATAITPPNNTLVGFGTDATWAFAYTDYQASLVSIIDPYGAGTQFNAMRTSDWITGNANPLNMISLTVHDKTVLAVPVWGAYDALERTAGASATNFFGREMSFHNMGASVSGDPFNVNPTGESVVLRLDSGVATGTGNAVTSALDIVNNGGKFNAGIKFGDGAIDSVSGHVNAIQMANGHEIVWYSASATPSGSLAIDASNILQSTALGGLNVAHGPVTVAGAVVASAADSVYSRFGGATSAVRFGGITSTGYVEAVDAATGSSSYENLTLGGANVIMDPHGGSVILASDHLRVGTPKTPASAAATGTTGDIAWDSGFLYVCVATDTWKRAAISTW